MAKRLVVVAGPDRGRAFLLQEGMPLLIGRSRHTETKLTDLRVSPVHCEVEVKRNRVFLTDLDSLSGTWVNGQRIREYQLAPNDVIRIGDSQLRIAEDASHAQAPMAQVITQAPLPLERLHQLTGTKFSYFEVGPVLARSQSGLIFKARDFKNERIVAFKVMSPEFSKNEIAMQRFVRAMKTMMPLRHPNLINLYGAGKVGPYCWISMEYVEGESLSETINRIGMAGRLDWKHALRVAIHVSRALAFAHERQVIHRNITPQNIMLRVADKVAKLGDLMLAKAQEGNLAQRITRVGEVVGDFRFMAPEQMTGAAHIDSRSDIYSLGAVVYTMLAGQPPFEGATLLETLTLIKQGNLPRPKKFQLAIPEHFEGIVIKMLGKRPEDRYHSAVQVLVELEKVAKFQGMSM